MVRKRTAETHGELTAQESHIVRLAVDGLSNPEIAAELYLSPRTVEWHLRNVFAKLGVSTRRELRRTSLAARVSTQGVLPGDAAARDATMLAGPPAEAVIPGEGDPS
jgi:DNA-binding NarL/FixJ family response regulator